ncbi:hypothetical protein Amet_2267 [Alkaliphilus metalliredigens QYMF]|uniref:DUF1643 domain-containing protein n=1 Tax=Alkaliphilus metalliredigens (strain QYMF) TaxID=293826 RepID=A6TQF7_ALKMQ|nr:DUF1643 domain-containing protein [Alkaliphilus metalliredigens]ABR48425.1 hypothetical protein Amet_2267 [Alkaliphilus metalliredigens QYMF]
MEFIGADELKQSYDVYASFYTLKAFDGTIFNCRNVAEIHHKGSRKPLTDNGEADAVIIMMNPGKCEPKYSDSYIPTYIWQSLSENLMSNKKILAKPDNAIYQIMRLMNKKDWLHVRVLNLSDIREPNGGKFKGMINSLKSKYSMHSIFDVEREKERESYFCLKQDAPIILAWGTDKVLRPLANKAVLRLTSKNTVGLKYSTSENLYYYPSPPPKVGKIKWLSNIL